MLEFGRVFEDFIKENFYRRNLFDKKFLEELRNVALSQSPYSSINKIESKLICLESLNTSAIYYPEDKAIEIYRFNLKFIFLSSFLRREILFHKDLYRMFIFVGLLHEIMHFFQEEMCFNDNRDLPHLQIIRDSISASNGDISLSGKKISEKNIGKAKNLYYKHYHYFPEERHADLSSFYFIYNIYKDLNPSNLDLLYCFNSYFIFYTLEEYYFKHMLTSPLKQFYRCLNRIDLFNKFDFDKYNLIDKYIFGMPLKIDELSKVTYPFVVFNDLGEFFIQEDDVARKLWEKHL